MTLIILIIIGVYIVGTISNKKELTKNGIKNLKDLEGKKSNLEEEIKDLNNLYENNKREYF